MVYSICRQPMCQIATLRSSVVIQRAVQSSAMQGDVYLHYNTLATNPRLRGQTMPIYSKPSDDLVYDLINLSNPLLPTPVTKTNVRLTAVTPIAAPTDFRNTTVEMVALPGGQYLGRESLKYRRLI